MTEKMRSDRKIMFSFWDGGRGHFTRSMTLASEARARGYEVGFITSEKYARQIGDAALNACIYVLPNRPPNAPPPPPEFPLYSHALRHAQRQKGLGFDNLDWLRSITAQEVEAIRDFDPAFIINDYRDTIRTAAQVCEVPLAGITHTTGNACGYEFGSQHAIPEGLVLPDCRDSFNQVRDEYGLSPIVDEREMFGGDISIIPSSPSIDPLREEDSSSFHVGMISNWKPSSDHVDLIGSDSTPNRVFSYVGEASRPRFGYEDMLSDVVASERDLGFYIVGDPNRYTGSRVQERIQAGEVKLDHFLPGPPMIEDSSVVLCPGSGGTTLLALSLGKPIVCVGAYHSDCSTRFARVEEQEAGIMLNHSNDTLERRPAPELGEGVEMLGYWQTDLTGETIRDAINRSIDDPKYRENARRLGREILSLGGVKAAMDICERELIR